MLWKLLFTGSLLSMMLTILPSTTAAQCGHFEQCYGAGGDHSLPEGTASNENAHSDCGYCLVGACHPVCGCGGDFASNPLLKRSYLDATEAARVGDVKRLLDLADGVQGYLFFNARRMSIQLRSCSGPTIIANLPVRSGLIASARRLPPSAQLFVMAPRQGVWTGDVGLLF